MTTPRLPSTAIDPPRGSGLAWGGPARRPGADRLIPDVSWLGSSVGLVYPGRDEARLRLRARELLQQCVRRVALGRRRGRGCAVDREVLQRRRQRPDELQA